MKKRITFLTILVGFLAQAQVFPTPYCNPPLTDVTVEEITTISIAGTNITNSDISSVLVDKTATIVALTEGDSYTVTVKGNTYGDFDNDIVAFVDWNHNDLLDDANEIFSLGTITNSDGLDAVSITGPITVPAGVLTGSTRIRIVKTYGDPDSPAIINPCAIEMDAFGFGAFPGYGQALDFTVNVSTLGISNFSIAETVTYFPVPTKDVLNIKNSTNLKSVKIYNVTGQEVLSKNTNSSTDQINVSKLAPGIYIVNIISDNGTNSFKVVKE